MNIHSHFNHSLVTVSCIQFVDPTEAYNLNYLVIGIYLLIHGIVLFNCTTLTYVSLFFIFSFLFYDFWFLFYVINRSSDSPCTPPYSASTIDVLFFFLFSCLFGCCLCACALQLIKFKVLLLKLKLN